MNKKNGNEPLVILKDPGGHFNPVPPVDSIGSNITWHLPPKVGAGYFTTTFLSSGLTLTLSRCALQSELHARLQSSLDDCTLVFSVKGRSLYKNAFFKKGLQMDEGFNYLYWFPDPELVREAPRGEELQAIVLTFPKNRLHSSGIIENTHESIWSKGLGILHGGQEDFCYQKNATSQTIRNVLEQIINCPFQGQVRQLFLESKALELMALKLDMIAGKPTVPEGMNDEQMQGVIAAKELLLKDMQSPPTIHELARVAGMSHPRLEKYFKWVFGCSPFEFLRKTRLQIALEMVGANEMSLTEIAYANGYSNSSHFSKAFLDYYGIQPSHYRKNKIGNPFYSIPESIMLTKQKR